MPKTRILQKKSLRVILVDDEVEAYNICQENKVNILTELKKITLCLAVPLLAKNSNKSRIEVRADYQKAILYLQAKISELLIEAARDGIDVNDFNHHQLTKNGNGNGSAQEKPSENFQLLDW